MKDPFRTMSIVALGAAALLAVSREARAALEILDTLIDERGDLVLDVADDPPPVPVFNYVARAQVQATFFCINASGIAHPELYQLVTAVVERRQSIPLDVGGGIRGTLRLELPRDRVALRCPRTFEPKLASVNYIRIEVRNQLGGIASARNDYRVFFPPP
jgi:hypothetical protein